MVVAGHRFWGIYPFKMLVECLLRARLCARHWGTIRQWILQTQRQNLGVEPARRCMNILAQCCEGNRLTQTREGHRAGLILLEGVGDQTLRPERKEGKQPEGIASARAAQAEKSLRDCLEEGAGKEWGKEHPEGQEPGGPWRVDALGRQ